MLLWSAAFAQLDYAAFEFIITAVIYDGSSHAGTEGII